MPKHIHGEHYLSKPHELLPEAIIHPEIEHCPDDGEHYMLPAVFTLKNGERFTAKYLGPGVVYISEGEAEIVDKANPGQPIKLSAGAVMHVEDGSTLEWFSPSEAKGFAAFWVPNSVKGFNSFIVRN